MFRLGRTKNKASEPKTLVVRVKDDVVPKVNDAVHQAVERTAPMRAEAKVRTSAAWHALRGDYQVTAPAKQGRKNKGLVVGAVAAVAAVGAATWAAARRLRTPDWVTENDAEQPASSPTSTGTNAEATASTSPRGSTKPTSDDEAGASPDEVMADMAETSYDGSMRR